MCLEKDPCTVEHDVTSQSGLHIGTFLVTLPAGVVVNTEYMYFVSKYSDQCGHIKVDLCEKV